MVAVWGSWAFCLDAFAGTIQVPGDHPTIQDAIVAASPGDIIEIAPGTWTGPFSITKDLSLRGTGGVPGAVVLTNSASSTARVLVVGSGIDATVENLSFEDAPAGAVLVQSSGSVSCFGVVFRNNQANLGAAIQLNAGSALVFDSRFVDNASISGGVSDRGSAISTTGFNSFSNLFISGSTFRRNTGSKGVISVFHGIATINESLFEDANDSVYMIDAGTNSDVTVTNSILTGMSGNAPFRVGEDTELVLTNVTVAENECTGAGLASGSLPASVDVRNSIVRFDESLQLAGSALTVTARYSNITGGLAGPGNIDADPMFKSDTLFQLDAGSPCIDAADSTVTSAPVDYSGQPRFTDDLNIANNGNGPLPILDMGATERQPAIRYVDSGAAAGGDGLSWASAQRDLQDALDDAAVEDVEEIWIATGTYVPDRGTGNRTMSFEMQNNLEIIGGFAGTETRRDDRNPSASPTTLGGAIGDPGVEDNTFHVVRASGVDSSAVLRDVIIQRGNATGAPFIEAGAGIFVFQGSPRFRDIVVRLCESDAGAAAIYTNQSDATFGRVRVLLNGLNSSPGGAVGFFGGSPLLLNSLVHGNSVSDLAAVNLVDNTAARIVNSTIVGNSSEGFVAGVYKDGGQVELHNSIVWGNTPANPTAGQPLWANNVRADGMEIRFTTVEGWGDTDANGANGYEPRFVNAAGPDGNPGNIDDNYRLAAGSCLIDSADNGLVPFGADADFLRNPRFLDDPGTPDSGFGDAPIVDRGAYEFQGETTCSADLNGDGQIDLADLNIVLANFGQSAPGGDSNCDGVLDLTDLNAVLASFGLSCN
jgi:hypothetical protein